MGNRMTSSIKTTARRPAALGLLAGAATLALAAGCASASTSSSATSSSAPAGGGSAPASAVATARMQFMTAISAKSFSATVDALKHSVAANGMMVLGSLNQAAALSVTGLSLPGAETFFVGNPTTGKMFFQADPAIGAVVPVRMYVWQGPGGKPEIGYFDPGPLFRAISPKLAAAGAKISMMAAQITKGA